MSQVQDRLEDSTIYDDIKRAYQEAPFAYSNFEAEINPAPQRIYAIGREIGRARADRLDRQYFTEEYSASRTVSVVRSVSRNILGREIIKPKQVPLTEATLKNWENNIGIQIFQDDPTYTVEAFFNDDPNNWYFKRTYESYAGSVLEDTLHFEIISQGVLKISSQPEVRNQFITGEELENFLMATEIYRDRVMSEVYNTSTQN